MQLHVSGKMSSVGCKNTVFIGLQLSMRKKNNPYTLSFSWSHVCTAQGNSNSLFQPPPPRLSLPFARNTLAKKTRVFFSSPSLILSCHFLSLLKKMNFCCMTYVITLHTSIACFIVIKFKDPLVDVLEIVVLASSSTTLLFNLFIFPSLHLRHPHSRPLPPPSHIAHIHHLNGHVP